MTTQRPAVLLRPRWRLPAIGRSRAALTVALIACASAALIGGLASAAYFGDQAQAATSLTAGRIFPGTRTSSAFSVQDASGGGAEVDRSSPFAVDGDGLAVTTGAWSSAFSGSQYFQLDLSAPLPAELSVSGVAVNLTLASTSPAGTLCIYLDVRRASDNALQATYGSAASPLVCATGTTPVSFGQAISAGTSDAFNDLRLRVYGRDSASGGAVIDEATVTGSTPFVAFTLFPIRTLDATGPTLVTTPWELHGP